MLLSFDHLRGFGIGATDGELGKASDVFFDDIGWTVRYLVVDTGWLFGRSVLLAPESIESVDTQAEDILVSLTKQEIEEAPGIHTALPVSRQEEFTLRNHFGWPTYWNLNPAGLGAHQLGAPGQSPGSRTAGEISAREHGNPNLRSASEVGGYHISATDGEVGHVDDFIIDEDGWVIRYIVVDTRNWLPGRKVLISPEWATAIDWAEGTLGVGMDRDAIKNSPRYEPDKRIERDYETSLFDHYQRGPYWA